MIDFLKCLECLKYWKWENARGDSNVLYLMYYEGNCGLHKALTRDSPISYGGEWLSSSLNAITANMNTMNYAICLVDLLATIPYPMEGASHNSALYKDVSKVYSRGVARLWPLGGWCKTRHTYFNFYKCTCFHFLYTIVQNHHIPSINLCLLSIITGSCAIIQID